MLPLECAITAIDQANQQDPNRAEIAGQLQAKEYVYSQHMTRWLFKLEPNPSELMQIACRAQHLERWIIPRNTHPMGLKGYYQWRTACNEMHGQRAAEIMAQCGYDAQDCQHVATVISKRELRQDADTQLLEDVACLVFLERYFAEFYEQKPDYDEEKWLRIVSRTWAKMSERARAEGVRLASGLPDSLQKLLKNTVQIVGLRTN